MSWELIVFDLDDTLYPEVQFVYSGFLAVSDYLASKFNLDKKQIFDFLIFSFENGNRRKNFDLLIEKFKIPESVNKLVRTYRNHYPKISLYPDSKYILEYLKSKTFKVALITDGYPITQFNKIDALRLIRYLDVISVNDISRGESKLNEKSFLKVLKALNVQPDKAVYVGDNPEKDFVIPNKLGMLSVRIIRKEGLYSSKDDDPEFPPDYKIPSLVELIEIIERE